MKFDFPQPPQKSAGGPPCLGVQLMAWEASWGTKQKAKGSQQLRTWLLPCRLSKPWALNVFYQSHMFTEEVWVIEFRKNRVPSQAHLSPLKVKSSCLAFVWAVSTEIFVLSQELTGTRTVESSGCLQAKSESIFKLLTKHRNVFLFFSCRETSWPSTSIVSSLEPSPSDWPTAALASSLWLLPKCWPVGGECNNVSHFPDVPWNCVPWFSSFSPSHFV